MCVEQTTFPEAINTALEDCTRAHELILSIKNGLEDVPVHTSSPVNNYCNIRLHVNSAVESSIRSVLVLVEVWSIVLSKTSTILAFFLYHCGLFQVNAQS